MARVVVILLLALVLGGTSSVVASAQALPGDALYPLKLATEQTRLLLTSGTAARLNLEQSFDQKRLEELNALLQRSRSEEIIFAGELTSMQADEWNVQGVRVLLQEQTVLPDKAFPGFYVEVQGMLQADGSVLANRISVRRVVLGGMIEAIEGELWIIEGLTVRLDTNTLLRGQPVVGQRAQVDAYRLADGSLLASAITMESAGQDSAPVTPTQVATQTSTATLVPTRTPLPSATQIASPTTEATQQLIQTEDLDDDDNDANDDNSNDDNGDDDNSNDDDSNDDNSNDDNSGSSNDDPEETEEPDEPTKTPEPDDD